MVRCEHGMPWHMAWLVFTDLGAGLGWLWLVFTDAYTGWLIHGLAHDDHEAKDGAGFVEAEDDHEAEDGAGLGWS